MLFNHSNLLLKSFLYTILILFSSQALSKTLYVEKWGDDRNSCTRSAPCNTIQHAINQSKKNDRVIIGPGIYVENVLINLNSLSQPLDGIKLEASAGRYGTFIEAEDPNIDAIRIFRPKVKIGRKGKGFTVSGATGEFKAGISIAVVTAEGVKIEGNQATGNAFGFLLTGSKLQIRHNRVKDNFLGGIGCALCSRAIIADNQIVDNVSGISMSGEKLTIQRNLVAGTRRGFLTTGDIGADTAFVRAKDNVSYNNNSPGFDFSNLNGSLFQGNIASINDEEGFDLVQLAYSAKLQIKDNLSVGNGAQGIKLLSVIDGNIDRNTAVQNSDSGISFFGPTLLSSLKENSTYRNDPTGLCDLENATVSLIFHDRHFFGDRLPFGSPCGPLDGTISTRPGPLRINRASNL